MPVLSVVVGLLVDALDSGDEEEYMLYVYFALIFFLLIVPSLAFAQAFFHSVNVGTAMKGVWLKFIYEKTLRVSSRSVRGVSAGKLISLAAADCEVFEQANMVLGIILAPFILALSVVLLYLTIGPAALATTGYSILLLVFMQWIAKA